MRFNNQPTVSCAAAFALLLACGQPLSANQDQPLVYTAQQGVLSLRAAVVATADLPNLLENGRFIRARHYVIALDGPMTPTRRQALAQAGVVLGQYLPKNAFTARMDRADIQAVRGLGFVTWDGAFENALKIDP